MRQRLLAIIILMMSCLGMNKAWADDVVVNRLSELVNVAEGTTVKVMLTDVHTTAYYYDFWAGAGYLYMQDAETGVAVLGGIGELRGGKTLNGYVIAQTQKVGNQIGLKSTSDTNVTGLSTEDWTLQGAPATLSDIKSGKYTNMLVTLTDVTKKADPNSSYACIIMQDGVEMSMYDDLGVIDSNFGNVPEKMKSCSVLALYSEWDGDFYLTVVSKDLLVEDKGDQPGEEWDGAVAETLSDLTSLTDGTPVKVMLNNVHTSALCNKVLYMQDEQRGIRVDGGIGELTGGKTVTGYVIAQVQGGNLLSTDATNANNLTATSWTLKGVETTLADVLAGKYDNRLVTLTNVTSEKNPKNNLSCLVHQDDLEIEMYDDMSIVRRDWTLVPKQMDALTAMVFRQDDKVCLLIVSQNLMVAHEDDADFDGTVVNTLAEMKGVKDGTRVKLKLNNVHTTAYYYNYWTKSGYLYLQDETTAIRILGGIGDLRGGKTLNGYVIATAQEGGLSATTETNTDKITTTDWDYVGIPAVLADVAAGKCDNMLVEVTNLTSAPTESSYYVNLIQGETTVKLYEELGVPNFSFADVPANIKSITGLIMRDETESYMTVVASKLIIADKDEELIEGATLIKTMADLKMVDEGQLVYVRLSNARVSATGYDWNLLSGVTYMQDATAGTVLLTTMDGLTGGKTLNGGIYATTVKVGPNMGLKVCDHTSTEGISITGWDYQGIPQATVSELTEGRYANMLVNVRNLHAEALGSYAYTLSNKLGDKISIYDEFGAMENVHLPEYLQQISVIDLWSQYDNEYYVSLVTKDAYITGTEEDFLQGDGTIEPIDNIADCIADLKEMASGTEFTWNVNGAVVTFSLFDSGSWTWTAILEDETGAMIASGLPFETNVGDAVYGEIYGTLDYEKGYLGYRVLPNDNTYLCDVETVPSEVKATKMSIAQAKTDRWHSCLVELENVTSYDGTWDFMGFEQNSKVLTDGQSTIYCEDGWEVMPEGYELPTKIRSIKGFIQVFYGVIFIYPFDENSVIDANNDGLNQLLMTGDHDIYTLDGRKVSKGTRLHHGIYVVGNKKVAVE